MSDPKDTVASAESKDEPAEAEAKPAAKAESKPAEADPNWLNARLERERVSMLKKFGFESVEQAQAVATELKAKREAEKSATEKAAEALARATTAETKQQALSEAVSEFASLQMAGLSDEQKKAVTLIAGDDPALQLKAITALQSTWTKPAEAAKAVDTTPAPNAPSAATTSETNHRAQYEALQKSNPFAAAAYGLAHAGAVFGKGA